MVGLLGLLGAVADQVDPTGGPSMLTRIDQQINPNIALQQQQAQAEQLGNQQTMSTLAALAAAKKANPNATPQQLYGAIASSSPSTLASFGENYAKNPVGMSSLNFQASQPNASQQPTQPGQAPVQDPSILQPENPDDKRNYQFLNTQVPPQYRSLVRQISNGDESVGNADSLRQNGLLPLAAQFDPSLNKTDFNTRQATAKDIAGGGKSGQALTAGNTAVKHLAQVALAGLDLHNSNNIASNWLGNMYGKATGQEPLTNYDSTVQTVAPELAKAAASGGDTTDADRNAQRDAFGGSMSPTQLLGSVANKADLIQSKAEEIGNTYEKNMGGRITQTITPDNQKILLDLRNLHELAKQDKLDTPDAKAIVKRLRGAVGQDMGSAPSATQAPAQRTATQADITAAAQKTGKSVAQVKADAVAKGYKIQ